MPEKSERFFLASSLDELKKCSARDVFLSRLNHSKALDKIGRLF